MNVESRYSFTARAWCYPNRKPSQSFLRANVREAASISKGDKVAATIVV